MTTASVSGARARAPGQITERSTAPAPVTSAPAPTTLRTSVTPSATREPSPRKLSPPRASSHDWLAFQIVRDAVAERPERVVTSTAGKAAPASEEGQRDIGDETALVGKLLQRLRLRAPSPRGSRLRTLRSRSVRRAVERSGRGLRARPRPHRRPVSLQRMPWSRSVLPRRSDPRRGRRRSGRRSRPESAPDRATVALLVLPRRCLESSTSCST